MTSIKTIEPVLLTVPLPRSGIRWAGGAAQVMTHAIVQVTDSDGISGLGELYAGGLWAPAVSAELIRYFAATGEGGELNSAGDIAAVVQRMQATALYWGRSGISVEAISAIECALWDILGQRGGVPVSELIGGAVHETLPVYASGGLLGTEAELLDELDGYVRAGFGRVKIRVGWTPEYDIERVRAAREFLPAGIGLAVDAVKGHDPNPWSAAEAVAMARRLQEFDLDWLEEPCAAEDIAGYAAVRSGSSVPVSGGESTARAVGFARFFDAEALDVAQPDAVICGGIGETLEIGRLAAVAGCRVAPHSWGSPIVLAPNYHAGFAMAGCFTLETPTYADPLADLLWVERPRLVDGRISKPSLSGLGLQLPAEVRRDFAYRGETTSVAVPRVAAAAPAGRRSA